MQEGPYSICRHPLYLFSTIGAAGFGLLLDSLTLTVVFGLGAFAILSLTARRGTVRGLHYQRAPAAETKLVRPVAGSVWDVIVDLRVGSPTYLRWQAVTLTAGDDTQVLIPEGVAHGFQALSDDAQLLYFHSHAYSPEHESGVRYDDPRLAIAWPLPVVHLSPRDAAFAPLDGRPEGVTA
jgi:dTDP-4-dehydrorhamnose 3,5-epimerase